MVRSGQQANSLKKVHTAMVRKIVPRLVIRFSFAIKRPGLVTVDDKIIIEPFIYGHADNKWSCLWFGKKFDNISRCKRRVFEVCMNLDHITVQLAIFILNANLHESAIFSPKNIKKIWRMLNIWGPLILMK